jgi:putative tryptophan/tyrosine transport system substrate-binding protein
MRRREFIAGIAGAAAWSVVARAQRPAIPVIGYLSFGRLDTTAENIVAINVAAVHRGLSETGFIEGRNLAVEYRWAEDRLDRLPALAADLVRRRVAVIVAMSIPAARAAKTATESIPIVFAIGADPVEAGLVSSLNRPGGNLTGITYLSTTVAAKRLQLLHELVPAATTLAFLVNPADPAIAETETKQMEVAARLLGVRLLILKASDQSQFEAAFATLVVERAGGLVVGSHALFLSHFDQLVALAVRRRVPATYPWREAATVGGLTSIGTDRPDAWRRVGVYSGRILKGEKPADLPVQQVTKIEHVINLKTAKALGLTIPETLLATADEVIQ